MDDQQGVPRAHQPLGAHEGEGRCSEWESGPRIVVLGSAGVNRPLGLLACALGKGDDRVHFSALKKVRGSPVCVHGSSAAMKVTAVRSACNVGHKQGHFMLSQGLSCRLHFSLWAPMEAFGRYDARQVEKGSP